MNTSTKQTENLAECGNKSKPLLAEVYLRIGEDNFYKIKDKECTSISIKRGVMKKNVSLPSAYMNEVFISDEKEFNQAKKQIGF